MSKYPSTVIAYEGQSQLTGEPIVMLLTNLERPSTNSKTGHMVQAVILDSGLKPTEAVKAGTDENICGNCPLRRGICYVNLIPWNNVYQNYQAGKIPYVTNEVLERAKASNKKLQITAYGDPASVPIHIWMDLLEYFPHHTGYTHQWRSLDSRWSKFLMASCETENDVLVAQYNGWSTFRVRTPGSPLMTESREIECPNVANPKVQCSNCRLCAGTRGERTRHAERSEGGSRQRHISIEVHGLDWKVKNYESLTKV